MTRVKQRIEWLIAQDSLIKLSEAVTDVLDSLEYNYTQSTLKRLRGCYISK